MSDDDDFMQDSDPEQYDQPLSLLRDAANLAVLVFRYDFEYEDDDEPDTGDVDVENKYYNAKQMKADNPEEAVTEFLGLPALEQEKGDWSVTLESC